MRGPLVTDGALMHEVHPGLWLGGSWEPYEGEREFDVVITVCKAWEAHDPPECRSHLEFPLSDSDREQQREIDVAVRFALDAVDRGLRTLVRCYAGQNRSALVVATVLARITGASGADVVAHLRRIRGEHILWNRTFEAALLAIEPWEAACARECVSAIDGDPPHIPDCRRHAPRYTLEITS
jgi:hypothetical protein